MDRRNLVLGLCVAAISATFPVGSGISAGQLKIPHIRQEKDLCVPTSVAMVLGYFGDKRSPRELKVLSRGKEYDPDEKFNDFSLTSWKDMRGGLRSIGYNWNEVGFSNDGPGFSAGIKVIKRSIDRGLPVLVDVALYNSHTFVIVGYDDKKIYVKDPMRAPPGDGAYSYAKFEKIWNGVSYGYNKRPAMFTAR